MESLLLLHANRMLLPAECMWHLQNNVWWLFKINEQIIFIMETAWWTSRNCKMNRVCQWKQHMEQIPQVTFSQHENYRKRVTESPQLKPRVSNRDMDRFTLQVSHLGVCRRWQTPSVDINIILCSCDLELINSKLVLNWDTPPLRKNNITCIVFISPSKWGHIKLLGRFSCDPIRPYIVFYSCFPSLTKCLKYCLFFDQIVCEASKHKI